MVGNLSSTAGGVDDYQFGITRGAGAIAETGTIILNDASTSTRLERPGALGPRRGHPARGLCMPT